MLSHLKQKNNNYSVTSIGAQGFIGTTPTLILFRRNLHTPMKTLSSPRKQNCFQKDGKSAHAEQCAKSRVLTKVIDTILEND